MTSSTSSPGDGARSSGIANRTDFDLKAHAETSGGPLRYFDEETKQHITPYVVEPSAGLDRAFLTFLVDAYAEEDAPAASGKSGDPRGFEAPPRAGAGEGRGPASQP